MRIKSLKARQIINSEGLPTLQVEISTSNHTAYSSVPLAASKSKYEFQDAYDNKFSKFHEETLETIVNNVERIVGPEMQGKRAFEQEELDKLLLDIDGSLNRSKLGVNTITAISQSIAKLGALESDLPLFKYIRVLHDYTGNPQQKLNSKYILPKPVVTIYKSSHHDLKSNLPAQEILILPKSSFSYRKSLISFYKELEKITSEELQNTSLDSLLQNLDKNISKSKAKLSLGLDMAASRYNPADSEEYIIPNLKSLKSLWKGNSKKLISLYVKWAHDFNLAFLEDIFAEDDYSAWHEYNQNLYAIDSRIQLVGDDFTATNMERLDKVSLLECCNNVVIKPSQIGTITECILFAQKTRKHHHNITVSYRKGETEDTFISDMAAGLNAEFIRTGYHKGSEFVSKINRLVQIEDETGY